MKRFALGGMLFMVISVGCCFVLKARPTGGEVSVSCGTTPDDISVVTYNAAIAPGLVGYASPRLPHVVESLAAIDFDVLCLQEVWTEEAKLAILDKLDLPPANTYYVETRGEGETGQDVCTEDDLSGISACVREHCDDVQSEQMSICAVRNCKARGVILYFTSRPCLNCLIATAGKGIDEVERICIRDGGASYLFDGQNGVMLLSRFPLQDREVIRLRSSGANRVALFATIDTGRGGPIEVACSHLSSKSHVLPTHPDFSRWEDEQRAQLQEINDVLEYRAHGRPRLLVGDLNIGRENGWYLGDHLRPVWDTAMELGYRSPADEAKDPFCSSCAANTLRRRKTNFLIDHVMIYANGQPPPLTPVCTERLLDEEVDVLGYDGRTVRTSLSDHYAVKVVFRPR